MEKDETGAHVRAIRLEKGLSQKEMAEQLDIPQSYLSEIEAGKKDISIRVIRMLMEHFDVSADWLLAGGNAGAGSVYANGYSQIKNTADNDVTDGLYIRFYDAFFLRLLGQYQRLKNLAWILAELGYILEEGYMDTIAAYVEDFRKKVLSEYMPELSEKIRTAPELVRDNIARIREHAELLDMELYKMTDELYAGWKSLPVNKEKWKSFKNQQIIRSGHAAGV